MAGHELSTRPSCVGLPVFVQRGVSFQATELLTCHVVVWWCLVAGWWVCLWCCLYICRILLFIPRCIRFVVLLSTASLFLSMSCSL